MSKYLIYKKNLIERIEALSNKEFQEIAWFENNQGLSASYGGSVSDLFDDGNLKQALFDDGVIMVSQEADDALRELYSAVHKLGFDKTEAELIDSPEMDVVRHKASKALELVKTCDFSESTEEILEQPT